MEWKGEKSTLLCTLVRQKLKLFKGIWSNKRKLFVKPVRMNGSNFKNETLFVSFTAIITTRNGWNGTNFYIGLLSVTWLSLLYKFIRFFIYFNARNVRLYYPYWQYTDLFIFQFVFLLCLCSTLRLVRRLVALLVL